MRRWILAGILVVSAGWAGSVFVQRHREAVRQQRTAALWAPFAQGRQAFYTEKFSLAEKLFAEMLPAVEKEYANDARLAGLLSMLGTSYRVERKYEQAEPVLKRALEVYGRISPRDPVGTERTETNLAGIYLDQEDFASAEPYLSDAVSLCEKTPSMPMYERGNASLNLGFVRLMQGRYPEGEQLLDRSVEALSSDHTRWGQTDLANAFYRLGGVYEMENRYPEATQQFLKALEIQKKLLGPNSPEVSHTLEGLGQAYEAEGNGLKAKEFLKQAREIARHSPPSSEGFDGRILVDRGEAAQNQGEYARAESLYKQAIAADERTVGPEHPELARALVYLGCLYRDEQQFDIKKADPLLERALAIREKALGADHPSTANTLSDLSLLSFYEHKLEEAERYARRALRIQEKAYGADSLEVSTTLNRLGLAERDLKKLAQAEASLQRALTIREKRLPSNDLWIAVSLENLASVYWAQGNAQKAAALIKRAQAIRSRDSPS